MSDLQVDVLLRRIMQRPEIQRLRKVQANSLNGPKIKVEIAKVRQYLFREMAKLREHDLSTEELNFAEQLLGLRVGKSYSVAELQKGLDTDCRRDFDNLFVDVLRVRKGIEIQKSQAERYPTMVVDPMPTAEKYFGIDTSTESDVPEIDPGNFAEE